jgi:hypothetical protein
VPLCSYDAYKPTGGGNGLNGWSLLLQAKTLRDGKRDGECWSMVWGGPHVTVPEVEVVPQINENDANTHENVKTVCLLDRTISTAYDV